MYGPGMEKAIALAAFEGAKTDVTPLWLMRQAGRYLPEYRALREKAGSFLAMCDDPALAAEVTLQPMRRFDLDAAIIFSDILVVPRALGQHVYFVEGEGPKLDPVDFSALRVTADFEKSLRPVYRALEMVRAELPKTKALIGFAGGPWTLASYMIDGGGGHDFAKTKAFMRENRAGFAALIDVLSESVALHLNAQIAAGAQAVQVFESHAGQLSGPDFAEFVVRPVRKIVESVAGKVPVIGFAREAADDDFLRFAVDTGVNVVGVDYGRDMAWAARNLPPRLVLQGNLHPQTLRSGVGLAEGAARIKAAAAGRPFVFNLGHGVIKDTPPEHVADLVRYVHEGKAA